MKSWQEREKVQDRAAHNFDNYIKGVNDYRNPNTGDTVELPSGYDNAYTNGNGQYIMSNNANFDPNVGSNQHWQRMSQVQ